MTDIITIDRNRALDLMDQVVVERGADFVYPDRFGCLYVKDGGPSCLVGRALHKAGVSLDVLAKWDAKSMSIDAAPLDPTIAITDEARMVLNLAQIAQDCGTPWGDAVNHAREAPYV